MEEHCKEILMDHTKCEKLIQLLELCNITETEDLLELTNEGLNFIEEYCSKFLANSSNFIEFNGEKIFYMENKILFSPGLRFNIILAIEYLKNQASSNTTANASSWFSEFDEGGNRYPISSLKNPKNKEELIKKMRKSIIKRVEKKFKGINFPDTNFDFDIYSNENDKVISGLFYCHLCRGPKRNSKEIKFSFSREYYAIMSNILTHLKLHFPQFKSPPKFPVKMT